MNFKIFIYRTLTVITGVLFNVTLWAQPPGGPPPGGGGSTGTNPPCWQPECVPIDGGVAFLLGAGILLGVKMIYDQRIKSRA